jgi:hypothetical protein
MNKADAFNPRGLTFNCNYKCNLSRQIASNEPRTAPCLRSQLRLPFLPPSLPTLLPIPPPLPLPIHPHSHLSCLHRYVLLHHRPCRSPASASRCASRVPGRCHQRLRRQSPCRAIAAGSLTPSSSVGLLVKPLASRALASQLWPALLVNQRCRHGPSVITVTTASKMVLKVLSPPLSPLLPLAVNGALLI